MAAVGGCCGQPKFAVPRVGGVVCTSAQRAAGDDLCGADLWSGFGKARLADEPLDGTCRGDQLLNLYFADAADPDDSRGDTAAGMGILSKQLAGGGAAGWDFVGGVQVCGASRKSSDPAQIDSQASMHGEDLISQILLASLVS